MEIVMRKVSELTPYDKNAKKHDATQVANVNRYSIGGQFSFPTVDEFEYWLTESP